MARKSRGLFLNLNPSGIYEIRWSEGGRTCRRSTGTSDFQQAQKILANFLLLNERDQIALKPSPSLSVLEIMGDPDHPQPGTYWHHHVIPKVVNKETAAYSVKKLLAYFGPMAVKDIMPEHVSEFIAKRRSGEIGQPSIDATIERDLSVLRAAINHAVRNRKLKLDEVPPIEKLQGSPPKDRWLTHEEADRLLAAARLTWDKSARPQGWAIKPELPRIYKFVAIALNTGSRKTAILELTKSQVDLKRRMIQFNPTGRRQTKKRRPAVPISDALFPIMEQIVAEAEGDLLLGSGCIRTAFEGLTARTGLTDVTPHTLRHTWATWAAQAGVPLLEIAAVLGDTFATVEKNYLHHCPEHLRSAVNSVGRAGGR